MHRAGIAQTVDARKLKNHLGADDAIVVFVTAASLEQAEQIAHALVGERLAACANIVSPIRSIYRWKDEIQNDAEHLMIIKTRANLLAKLETRVRALHSYEVPEVIALPIVAGAKPYLDWISDSTVAARSTKTSRPSKGKRPRKN
jgi:periplasmic divalent cation tolerance protein